MESLDHIICVASCLDPHPRPTLILVEGKFFSKWRGGGDCAQPKHKINVFCKNERACFVLRGEDMLALPYLFSLTMLQD